ncbi:hypothetical protein BTM25_43020 [Actinomadura rubteroloni]|uniref:Uncharacterized protein n=1 Tax=Actinomadura rubteroloni TaxID=1926885 RepID=A0A2P4UDM3_9ACTN|nr:hypothetical protein [Actinomadura rubteroloni]POM23150.1 hypothetical protein BTM25_43020 [Actinomadura rubteroloni]
MIVHIDDQGVTVLEGDDCTRLSVATTLPPDATDRALRGRGLGRATESGTAELAVADLRALASEGAAADWPDRWDAMIAYARRNDWLSADGLWVQAHIAPA